MYYLINELRSRNPLVVHYTNEVTINDCANVTLAVGASPLMSYSTDELTDVISIASAVVVNIGTMANPELYLQAGITANRLGKPVIFDPVGVFASDARKRLTNKFLQQVQCDVIKGNGAEIQYLAGIEAQGLGVDSHSSHDLTEIARQTALKFNSTIVATGSIDIITDYTKVIKITNGTPLLKKITGSGCMTASLITSVIRTKAPNLECAAMGVLTMAIAGEMAAKTTKGTATLRTDVIDNISNISQEIYTKYAAIEITTH